MVLCCTLDGVCRPSEDQTVGRCLHRAVVRLFALLMTLSASIPVAQAPTPSSLLDRAGAYVQRYEERFAVVISDEEYEQRADGRSYRGARFRKIASEMMFLWLPGEQS
jgi:hypothetical protein